MVRKKLSGNNVIGKTVYIIFILMFTVIMIAQPRLSTLLGILILSAFFYYRMYYLPDKIEYDTDKMYVINKDGETEVDLKNVDFVTRHSFTTNGLAKVNYHFQDKKYYVKFYPRYFTSALKDFKNDVKNKNPNADVNDLWSPLNFK